MLPYIIIWRLDRIGLGSAALKGGDLCAGTPSLSQWALWLNLPGLSDQAEVMDAAYDPAQGLFG